MNSPTKSAPVTGGQLTPEDADRFAAMFKPIWELDDAPFAQAKPGALTGQDVQQLGRAGVHADVQLASNGTAAAAGPHAPPAAHHAPMDDGSIVLDIQPDPTPPPQTPRMQQPPTPAHSRPPVPQHVQQVVHAIPQQQQAPRSRRSAPPPAVRHAMAADSGEFAPPKKSNAPLFIGIAVVTLLIGSAVAWKVVGSSKTEEGTKTTATATTTHEEPRIPPPPPVVDTTPTTTTTTTAAATTAKPVDTTPPAVTTAPPATTTKPTVAAATTKPPPVVHTTTATTKPTGKPGGGIVRDNPF